MVLARNSVLSNPDNFRYLPHALSTNVTLDQLPEERLQGLIASGDVCPQITDKRARAMVAEILSPGVQGDHDPNAWQTPPYLFERLSAQYGGFTIDLAASAENALCDRYYTKEDDALAQYWGGEVGFCNPPFDDIEPGCKRRWTPRYRTTPSPSSSYR